MKTGIYKDLTSDQYHKCEGTYSSSQLKDILEDPEIFYKKYVTRELEKERLSAFDVGTAFHTKVLEPHKYAEEVVVFDGTRRGAAWESFQEANKSKAILSANEEKVAETLASAVRSSPIASGRIARGEPEISAFLEVLIDGSDIYSPEHKMVLGRYGWTAAKSIPKKATKMILKVRADLLADGFILDLKSTTGNAKNVQLMRKKISDYSYDLSAALYLDIFSIVTGIKKTEFLWTFASKDFGNSRTYAASADSILIGRAKWRRAALNLAENIEAGWKFEDSMGILEPEHWQKEWLELKAEDLL